MSPKREQFKIAEFSPVLFGLVVFGSVLFCVVEYCSVQFSIVENSLVQSCLIVLCKVLFPSQVCLGRFDSDDGTIRKLRYSVVMICSVEWCGVL